MRSVEPFKAPVVESLSVRVVVDSVFDQFMPKATHPMVKIEHVGRIRSNLNSTLAGEWGLSLHLESRNEGTAAQYLFDFGYTAEVLLRNLNLLGIEPERFDGLILSHGHRDHYGGLPGFVAHYRDRMRHDLRLFAGGKENFREKWVGSRDEEPVSWGALDRAALEAARVETVCCDAAHALEGPFTTGNIARQSFERVLPNTLVEPTPVDHFTGEERRGRLVPDRHPDEHATCYVVQGRASWSSPPAAIAACSMLSGPQWRSPAWTGCTPCLAASIWELHRRIMSSIRSPRSRRWRPMWSFRCIVPAATSSPECAPKCPTA
jgi:7,8-dihydropterin-6-yl-methyl-4-(beta-D-ribofuranosyl)aminobenzene 5'-phosphate synthase